MQVIWERVILSHPTQASTSSYTIKHLFGTHTPPLYPPHHPHSHGWWFWRERGEIMSHPHPPKTPPSLSTTPPATHLVLTLPLYRIEYTREWQQQTYKSPQGRVPPSYLPPNQVPLVATKDNTISPLPCTSLLTSIFIPSRNETLVGQGVEMVQEGGEKRKKYPRRKIFCNNVCKYF